MKNLKPHSREWLEFARSIGATHYHKERGCLYKFCKRGLPQRCLDGKWKNVMSAFNTKPIDFSPLDNKPSEPDWSKAPEGANLFWTNKWTTHPWFKDENGKLYNFDGLTLLWVETKGTGFMPNEFIKRPTVSQQLTVPFVNQSFTTEKVACSKMEPTTWDGTGRPPFGTRCEVMMGSYWYKCNVIGGTDYASWVKTDHGDYWTIINEASFRPIRSERERWIIEAKKASSDILSSRQLGHIYDAGLAKLPEQPNDHSN